MNWMDFGLGYFLGLLTMAAVICTICFVIATVGEAWEDLKKRIKKLEETGREEGAP